jgi:hypothetical protein
VLARRVVQLIQEERRPVDPVEVHNGVERVPPLLSLARVQILRHIVLLGDQR